MTMVRRRMAPYVALSAATLLVCSCRTSEQETRRRYGEMVWKSSSVELLRRLSSMDANDCQRVTMRVFGGATDRPQWELKYAEARRFVELLQRASEAIPQRKSCTFNYMPQIPLVWCELWFADGEVYGVSFTHLGFCFQAGPSKGKMFVNTPLASWMADFLEASASHTAEVAKRIRSIQTDPDVRRSIEELHDE